MKSIHTTLLIALLGAATAALAQQPANVPQQQPTVDPGVKAPVNPANKETAKGAQGAATQSSTASDKAQPNRGEAYYHYQLGHMYEEMVAMTGRTEFASKAIDEYRTAIENDPTSPYLNSALAELYARTGRIRDAVMEAQDIIKRDPNNIDARRLLGRIYLRSIGDLQGGTQSDNVLKLAIEQYEQIVKLDPASVEDHLLLGRLYRLSNDSARAEKEFKTAVNLQPNSEDAVTTLALLYNEMGDTARAQAVLEAIPEAERSAKLYSVLGYTYEQKKDYKKAIEAYKKAVDQDKDNLDAVRGLAQNLLNDNQTEAALQQYQTIADADPQDAQTLLHMAEIYRRDGKFEQALEVLNKAQSIVQDSLEIEYNKALIEEAMGRFDDATKHLEALLSKTEKPDGNYSPAERNNRTIFLERLGSIYRDQNKTQQSVDTFRKMATLGDDAGPRAYQQIVESYREARQWPQATAAAREGVQKYPENRDLKLVLSGQEADSGKPDDAIATVKSMLTGKPSEDREVYIALGQMYSRLRRWPDAEAALKKAMDASTKPEEKDYVNFIAGSMYERQKKYDEAEGYFRKNITFDPKNATALNYLGYMLADRGTRLEEALTLIRRAVALDPQNGAYLDSLGWAYYKMGKYDLAEAALRKAVDRLGTDPTVHEHIGDLYQKTGRLKLAVTQWERALEEWNKTVPAEVETADVAKVQKKLDTARVKLAKEDASTATK